MDPDALRQQVVRVLEQTPTVDIHTHIYSEPFGELLLWGIDELLTYHYLVAEVFRAAAVIYLCAFSAWLDPDFLVTRAFLWQALANLVFAALIPVLGDGRSMVWRRLRPARTKT